LGTRGIVTTLAFHFAVLVQVINGYFRKQIHATLELEVKAFQCEAVQ